MRIAPIVLCTLVLLTGCATVSTVITGHKVGGETTRIYLASFDDACRISIHVFRWEGACPIGEPKAERYMLTEAGMNLYTYGTLIGAWFVPFTPTERRVSAVAQRPLKTNVFTVLTESTYHERFSEALNASRLVSRSQMRQRTDEGGKQT